MTEDKKKSRWVRNLHKAGLIGKVDDFWTISEDPEDGEAVIVVDAARDTDPPPRGPDSTSDAPEVRILSDLPDPKSALRSTDPPPPSESSSPDDLKRIMNERFEMGDHTGALEIADRLLEMSEEDQEASMTRLKCRKTLMQMYEARIGSFRRIPKKAISQEELIWRNLDPVAGFIAASVDGMLSFEDIIDISTLSRFDACRVLNQLLQDGIIK